MFLIFSFSLLISVCYGQPYWVRYAYADSKCETPPFAAGRNTVLDGPGCSASGCQAVAGTSWYGQVFCQTTFSSLGADGASCPVIGTIKSWSSYRLNTCFVNDHTTTSSKLTTCIPGGNLTMITYTNSLTCSGAFTTSTFTLGSCVGTQTDWFSCTNAPPTTALTTTTSGITTTRPAAASVISLSFFLLFFFGFFQ